ncbi:MAG: DUF4168 domain-containing protein [Cyanobacteria bacterium P01_G01_bin.49]
MLKQVLINGCLGMFISIAGLGGLPAYSQPGVLIAQSSADEPASEGITEEELRKFADAVVKLQSVDEATQAKMIEAVQGEGLSPERFMEIAKKEGNENTALTDEVTTEEQQKYEKALTKIKQLNEEDRVQKREAVQEAGLEVSRFNEIGKIVEDDRELQKQVVEMLPQ